MSIDKSTVSKIANLARIKVTEQDLDLCGARQCGAACGERVRRENRWRQHHQQGHDAKARAHARRGGLARIRSGLGGQSEGSAREAVGLAVAVARYPAKRHVLEVGAPCPHRVEQGHQARDRGAGLAKDMLDYEIAVAADVQPLCAGLAGTAQREEQGLQLGLIAAAGAGCEHGEMLLHPLGRGEDDAQAEAPRIGRGGAIKPDMPGRGGGGCRQGVPSM